MEKYIFHFNDSTALHDQCDETCQRLYEDLNAKTSSCAEGYKFTEDELDVLSIVKRDFSKLHWLSRYASVVLFRPVNSIKSAAWVVGLDQWKMTIHASTYGRERTAIPDVRQPAICHLGLVETTKIDEILMKFDEKLRISEADNTGRRRGQYGGHQGNQKTPTFAAIILAEVISSATSSQSIQGGTTDVGLHTGCIKRNTSFPLVLSALHTMLSFTKKPSFADELFNKVATMYLVGFLKPLTKSLQAYDARSIDRVIIVIREVESYLVLVKDNKFKEKVYNEMKARHDRVKHLDPNQPCRLEQESISKICESSLRAPAFPDVQELHNTEDSRTRLERARSESKVNLGWSSLNADEFKGGLQDAWVQLSDLNQFFWTTATQLHDQGVTPHISKLRKQLDRLCKTTDVAIKESSNIAHVMTVVLRSYKLLACWITFCWSHLFTERTHPLFNKYGVALNHADLKHVVLEDHRAILALDHVCRFLRERESRECKPFRDANDTLALALDFGRSSPSMVSIYAKELEATNAEIDARWEEISRKQAELKRLDPQLRQAEVELRRAENEVARKWATDSYVDRYGIQHYSETYYAAVAVRNSCQANVNHLKSQITNLERKPPNVLFGLPEGQDKAVQWLFYLVMPQEFQDLASLAHLGQSMLWASAPASRTQGLQSLSVWFQSYKRSSTISPCQSKSQLLSCSQPPRISTPGIRSFTRRTGIFFPDSYSLDPVWDGTDPFANRAEDRTVILYSEILPVGYDKVPSIQKFVPMLPTRKRENEGIANRENKPNWLSPEQYVVFSTLRAHPRTQIRNLVEAFADDLLPFDHTCVHVLVKQLVYHVGEEQWKMDLTEPWNGHKLISTLMSERVELLRDSPQLAEKLVLFGIVSSFFGQYNEECMNCAREFCRISRRLADEVEDELRDAEHVSQDAYSMYAKQAKLYGYALLCHSVGNRSDDDIKDLLELIVLFKNKFLFVSDHCEIKALAQATLSVMASRIKDVVRVAKQGTQGSRTRILHLFLQHSELPLLSKCLSLIVADTPQDLVWKPVIFPESRETACFEAESDHLYSLNVLNGTLLIDGVPPGLLPRSVTKDPLYRRTFGERDFEIVILGFRHYRTARLLDNCFLYEFVIDTQDQLHVIEIEKTDDGDRKLQLLPRAIFDLPPRLAESHSHWYSQAHNAVVLRGPRYRSRNVEYVITRSGTFQLPFKSQSCSLDMMYCELTNYDRVLLGETKLLKMLSRFEYRKYIHMTVDPGNKSLTYSLPRYTLDFHQTNSGVSCSQFDGFFMKVQQHFDDTLPGLASAIILQDGDGREKVLISDGKVEIGAVIKVKKSWDSTMRYHIYDKHPRFKSLLAKDAVGRLHLAALYASNGCHLDDRRMGMKGTAVAMELVRQCWKNEPLTASEREKLMEVSSLGKLSCTLRLVCWWIWKSSKSVSFLHPSRAALPEEGCQDINLWLEKDILAIDEYVYLSPKVADCLHPSEEFSLLGRQVQREALDLQHEPSWIQSFVKETEARLCQFIINSPGAPRPFPLEEPANLTGLEIDVYKDLEASYEIHHRQPTKSLKSPHLLLDHLLRDLHLTSNYRKSVQCSLLEALSHEFSSLDCRLAHLTGRRPSPTTMDLMRILVDPSLHVTLACNLTQEKEIKIRSQTIEWALLCVLEDKLERILKFHGSDDVHGITAELDCIREWCPFEHPRWLAFEVEQQLQIRPYQFSIVDQLLNDHGSAVQLNMGLGKTRVLVPMLVLEWMAKNSDLIRLNILPSIIHEAMDYYRNVLVASLQGIKLFSLPFQRDFPLEKNEALVLTDELASCKRQNGFLVVTPQHRNSLLLKQHDRGTQVDGLQQPFTDLIDESDAILHHDFQLVYALGSQVPLPDGPSRWNTFQTFLKILARDECPEISQILSDPKLVHRDSVSVGSFPKLHLLIPFREHEQEVGRALCNHLVDHPTYEFRWIEHVLDSEERALLVRLMCNPQENALESIKSVAIFQTYKAQILAIRGCIAYGLLFHGLAQRHRVDFGVDVGSNKKLAIPFSASDTPKDRSEFSHPDMALIYTCVSYLSEGLSEKQFKEALLCLLQQGPTARRVQYKEWVESVRDGIERADLLKFDNILKVDMTNSVQLSLMYKSLCSSMEVVCFWMNQKVFPTETYQFPSKRSTSAWNLVDSRTVGFSGTNDNRFLLPLAVKQKPTRQESLRATNGQMIDTILRCTNETIIEIDDKGGSLVMWQVVIEHCHSLGTSALVDVGGLMAGSRNRQVALFYASHAVGSQFRGVVYFNVVAKTWNVYEMENKRDMPLRNSSLVESECFVYFDESRCRGADMKLKVDARALVTVEPKMTKDKFLQGCARMRKLRPNCQTLILAGTSEAVPPNTTVKTVLEKIIKNTVNMTRKALPAFYDQGTTFNSFPAETKVDVSLDTMYANHITQYGDIADFLDSSYEVDVVSEPQQKLETYCKKIGEGMPIQASSLSQECERELEYEMEVEEEEEVEFLKQQPYTQSDWPFAKAFTAPEQLFGTFFVPLVEFVSQKLSFLSCIEWSTDLYCTPNFCQTILDAGASNNLHLYQRLVNAMLVLQDGRVVFISQYEVDQLLPHWWIAIKPSKAVLRHLCLSAPPFHGSFGNESIPIPDTVLSCVKLFRGYVGFSEVEFQTLLAMFQNAPSPRRTIEELLFMRDRLAYLDRSDLERFSFGFDH